MPTAFQYKWPERPGLLPNYRCLTLTLDAPPAHIVQAVRDELAKAGAGDEERDFQVIVQGAKVMFHVLRCLPFPTCRSIVDTIEEAVTLHNII